MGLTAQALADVLAVRRQLQQEHQRNLLLWLVDAL
jgi:hypothetical protein